MSECKNCVTLEYDMKLEKYKNNHKPLMNQGFRVFQTSWSLSWLKCVLSLGDRDGERGG